MIVTIGQVHLDITHDINIGEEMGDIKDSLGYCNYTYPKKQFKQFKKSDEEGVCFKHELDRDTNPDIFISFLDWWEGNNEGEFITITVVAQHPFWVFHDLCHAEERDVLGCEGNITAWIERDRLQKGVALMKEKSNYELDDPDYLEMIEDSFYNRFKERLALDEFDADELRDRLYREEFPEEFEDEEELEEIEN
jgi:hypothetical protein